MNDIIRIDGKQIVIENCGNCAASLVNKDGVMECHAGRPPHPETYQTNWCTGWLLTRKKNDMPRKAWYAEQLERERQAEAEAETEKRRQSAAKAAETRKKNKEANTDE